MADCCKKIEEGTLTFISGTTYELNANYSCIVSITAWGVILDEFTEMLPRTLKFPCKIPNELGCVKVLYYPEDTVCQECTCCN